MRPIDADSLKINLDNLYNRCGHCDGYGYYSTAKVLQTINEAPTIEQPTWISVNERLPTEDVTIEMFFPVSLSICLGYYKEIKKVPFWCVKLPDGTGRVSDEKPTHWRYRYIVDAPQPPKGVE